MTDPLLDRAAVMSIKAYHPAIIIETVNALQPLGKEGALARIDSYLESRAIKRITIGLFWVLRVLFDMPVDQGFPPVRIGRFNIPEPDDPTILPRFPIVLVHDVPLLVVSEYLLGGKAEPIQIHLEYFWAHGTLREQPLAPPAPLEGIEDAFLQRWGAAYGDAYIAEAMETVRAQIVRLIGWSWAAKGKDLAF